MFWLLVFIKSIAAKIPSARQTAKYNMLFSSTARKCCKQSLAVILSSQFQLSLFILFYFILKHHHQDKVCHFLRLLFIKPQQITSVWPSFFLGKLTCHIIFQLVDLRAQANTFLLTVKVTKVHKFEKTVVLYCWFETRLAVFFNRQ